ncbi:transmembrane protein, partial [Cystoisospora suis]
MMQVLQENNEVMTCVGSCLRVYNFELFEQANASIATFVAPDSRCRHCGGRCSSYASPTSLSPVVNPLFLSAANLNSLPCALQQSSYPVADPHVTMAVIYEAFRESRRIVDCIQQALTFCVSSSIFLSFFFLLNSLLLLP